MRVQFDCYGSDINTEIRHIKINGNELIYLDIFTKDSSLTLFLRPEQLKMLQNTEILSSEDLDCNIDC